MTTFSLLYMYILSSASSWNKPAFTLIQVTAGMQARVIRYKLTQCTIRQSNIH